jgi:hypothetical protein
MLAGLLPLLCAGALLGALSKTFPIGWRSAFLWASVAGGLLVTVTTEVLSLFELVTFGSVTAV